MSLNNYASHLSDAGQNEKALEHARQALEIYKRLVQKNPDRFEPDYATSLDNYASHLSAAGQNEEALGHIREALEIRKRLAQKNLDRFEPDYAMSLNNYANRLSNAADVPPVIRIKISMIQ
jgi:tetratricopeptide (TPR) repeat protein